MTMTGTLPRRLRSVRPCPRPLGWILPFTLLLACGETETTTDLETLPPVDLGEIEQSRRVRMSERGLELIRRHEAFRPFSYDDGAGNLTIGYGHLIRPDELFPDSLTEADAERLFAEDVRRVVDPALDRIEVELTQNQIDALGSFIYNVGEPAFNRDVLPALNAGDFAAATAEMSKYVRGRNQRTGEKIALRGLERRRQGEIELFNSDADLARPMSWWLTGASRVV